MRIIHFALSSFYIDNYKYQENVLPFQNKKDGHQVLIVASTFTFNNLYQPMYVLPSKYVNENEIEVIRIPYRGLGRIARRLRMYKGVTKILNSFLPDVIFFHGMCSYELRTVSQYVKKNPRVKFFVDTHADRYNSAQNFLSKNILHKIVYRIFYKTSERYIDKLFYITHDTKVFAEKMYCPKKEKMHYLPLGGIIIDEKSYQKTRQNFRDLLGIGEKDILFIHTGKINKSKRSLELFYAFSKARNSLLKLIVVGEFSSDIHDEALRVISSNSSITFLGWKSPSELAGYLCASDVYIQPGSQSATMQDALCNRCAVALVPYESHTFLLSDAAFYIESKKDMEDLFQGIIENRNLVEEKKSKCWKIATDRLDYAVLAKEMYK